MVNQVWPQTQLFCHYYLFQSYKWLQTKIHITSGNILSRSLSCTLLINFVALACLQQPIRLKIYCMKNFARNWCQKLCAFLFVVTCALGNIRTGKQIVLFSPPQDEIYYLVNTPESDGVALGVSTLYMQMQCLPLIYCTAKWYWCYWTSKTRFYKLPAEETS